MGEARERWTNREIEGKRGRGRKREREKDGRSDGE